MLAIVALGAVLRMAELDNRPMHCDEANQAAKFDELLRRGYYDYDPEEHHGPSLSLLTLPIARLAAAEDLTRLSETHLRLVPAIFGTVLIALVWLLRDELGRAATLWAALLTALSPAMVFYSRYYVQEMLLVCVSFAAIVALKKVSGTFFAPDPSVPGRKRFLTPFLLGVFVGMMHASKETCIIAVFAMAMAAVIAWGEVRRAGWRRIVPFALVVLITAAGSSALMFSALLTSPVEVKESYQAYWHYFQRASGEGTAGPHDQPWHHYFQRLFWWRRGGGPVWSGSEAAIAALALVGLVAAAWGKGLEPAGVGLARLLGVYTVLMTVIYSAIPYKTPWCALGFLHGMVLLGGIGAAVLVRVMPHWTLKAAAVLLVTAAAGHLGRQAHRTSFVAFEDPGNPYAYAQTTSDVLLLVEQIERIAAAHPDGRAMPIQVICPHNDFWPLPWYLRGFSRDGYLSRVPPGRPAPLIVAQPQMEPALLDWLYEQQPPGQVNLYLRVLREHLDGDWQLRPNVPLRMYVQWDLQEAYRAQQSTSVGPDR